MAKDFKTESIQVGSLTKAITETVHGQLLFRDEENPLGLTLSNLVTETSEILASLDSRVAAISGELQDIIVSNVSQNINNALSLIHDVTGELLFEVTSAISGIPAFDQLAYLYGRDNTFDNTNIFVNDTSFMTEISVGLSGAPLANVHVRGHEYVGSEVLTSTSFSLIATTINTAFSDIDVGCEIITISGSRFVVEKIDDNQIVLNDYITCPGLTFNYRKPMFKMQPYYAAYPTITGGLLVNSYGWIGVGAKTPLVPLHIKGSDIESNYGRAAFFIEDKDAKIQLGNIESEYGQIRYKSDPGQKEVSITSIYGENCGAQITMDAVDSDLSSIDTPSGVITFKTSPYSYNVENPMVERVRISNKGNLGINTDIPTSHLHVKGIGGSSWSPLIGAISTTLNDVTVSGGNLDSTVTKFTRELSSGDKIKSSGGVIYTVKEVISDNLMILEIGAQSTLVDDVFSYLPSIMRIDMNGDSKLMVNSYGNTRIHNNDGLQLIIANDDTSPNTTGILLEKGDLNRARIFTGNDGYLNIQTTDISGNWNSSISISQEGRLGVNITGSAIDNIASSNLFTGVSGNPYNLVVNGSQYIKDYLWVGNNITVPSISAYSTNINTISTTNVNVNTLVVDNVNKNILSGVYGSIDVDSVEATYVQWALVVKDYFGSQMMATNITALNENGNVDYTQFGTVGSLASSVSISVGLNSNNIVLNVNYPTPFNVMTTRLQLISGGGF